MARTLRSFVVLGTLAALALLGAACSSGSSAPADTAAPTSEAPSEEPSDEPPEEPSELPSVDLGGGELPEGFPEAFPLPDGAVAAGSASVGGAYVVWFSSGDVSVDDLGDYFDDELQANGWTIESQVDVDQAGVSYRAFVISGNGYTGAVYIGEGAPGSEGFEGDFAFWVQLSPEE